MKTKLIPSSRGEVTPKKQIKEIYFLTPTKTEDKKYENELTPKKFVQN